MGRGEVREVAFPINEIVFILKGRMLFSLLGNPGGEVRGGEVAFLPAGDKLRLKAITDSTVLIVRLTESLHLCNSFSLERLHCQMNGMKRPKSLYTLGIHPRLKSFARELTAIVEDGLLCRFYFRAEVTRLFILLRTYYPPDDLCHFFYPILSPDTAFSGQVQMYHLKHKSVRELAQAMNLSPRQFTRRFIAVFGQPPYEWMQKEKARMIYGELCMSDKPIKMIAADFGFNIQENFIRFCKTALGATPGAIRRNERSKSVK
jgi:AraC-like DNA-binding protein